MKMLRFLVCDCLRLSASLAHGIADLLERDQWWGPHDGDDGGRWDYR